MHEGAGQRHMMRLAFTFLQRSLQIAEKRSRVHLIGQLVSTAEFNQKLDSCLHVRDGDQGRSTFVVRPKSTVLGSRPDGYVERATLRDIWEHFKFTMQFRAKPNSL